VVPNFLEFVTVWFYKSVHIALWDITLCPENASRLREDSLPRRSNYQGMVRIHHDRSAIIEELVCREHNIAVTHELHSYTRQYTREWQVSSEGGPQGKEISLTLLGELLNHYYVEKSAA